MAIELSKQARADAIASIERWFREERDEKIGNIAAGALLGFVLEEIGPLVFNQAVAQVQERLQTRIMELDIEFHEDEFQYWRRRERAPGPVSTDARARFCAPRAWRMRSGRASCSAGSRCNCRPA
jgi:uncharacterized protein (DUF2164 family)